MYYVPSLCQVVHQIVGCRTEKIYRDFPGGPVVKTTLPMQGARVRSLVRELDPTCHNKDPACSN